MSSRHNIEARLGAEEQPKDRSSSGGNRKSSVRDKEREAGVVSPGSSLGHRTSGDRRKKRSGERATKPGATHENASSDPGDRRNKGSTSGAATGAFKLGGTHENASRKSDARKNERISDGASNPGGINARELRDHRKENRAAYLTNQSRTPSSAGDVVEAVTVEDNSEGEAMAEMRREFEEELNRRLATEKADREASEEEHKKRRKRMIIIIVVCLFVIIGAGVVAFFAVNSDKDATEATLSDNVAPSVAPVIPSPPLPTQLPSANPTPTSLFPMNTADDCERIALGEDVILQSELIRKRFDVRMDVSLTLELSDLSEVVEEMVSRMQRILGPDFGDCPNSRRLRQDSWRRRLQIEKNVIGNARFSAAYKPDQSCDASAPTPCIRVLTNLDLFLKSEEDMLPLANRITSLFGEQELTETLGLTAPFNSIEVVAVIGAVPSVAPTQLPSANPTPTPLFPMNTADDCERIALGEDVILQSELIRKRFDVRMDVSLTLELSDLSEVVEEMVSRMQRTLGPDLCDCPNSRRLRQDSWRRRLQIEKNVIGNVRFGAAYQPDQSCDTSAPTPCIRVLTNLDLFLKSEENTLPLANRITSLFREQALTETLGLTAPFNSIEVVALTAVAL